MGFNSGFKGLSVCVLWGKCLTWVVGYCPSYPRFISEGTRRISSNFGIRGLAVSMNLKVPVLISSMSWRRLGGVDVYHARICNLCMRWSGFQLHILFTSVSRNEPRRLLDRSEFGLQNRPGCDGERRPFRPCLESNVYGSPRCPVPVLAGLRRFIDIMRLPGEFNFGWYRWKVFEAKNMYRFSGKGPITRKIKLGIGCSYR